MILRYREAALERLEVDLTAWAFGEPTLEYQLTRLFLAYGGTMEEDTQPTLVVRKNGRQVGLYTRSGFQVECPHEGGADARAIHAPDPRLHSRCPLRPPPSARPASAQSTLDAVDR